MIIKPILPTKAKPTRDEPSWADIELKESEKRTITFGMLFSDRTPKEDEDN